MSYPLNLWGALLATLLTLAACSKTEASVPKACQPVRAASATIPYIHGAHNAAAQPDDQASTQGGVRGCRVSKSTLTPSSARASAFAAAAQHVQTEDGLKDLAAPQTIISTLIDIDDIGGADPAPHQQAYRSLIDRDFSGVHIGFWPKQSWTGETTYDFAAVNTVINWAHGKGLTVTAGFPFGPVQYMPTWLVESGNDRSAEALDALMEGYIRAALTSNDNASKIDVLAVVNEPFWVPGAGSGEGYVGTFWNEMGWEDDASGLMNAAAPLTRHPVYIRKAFGYARQYAPDTRLEIRERRVDAPESAGDIGDHYTRYYQLVQHLLNTEVPLDVVSIQGRADTARDFDAAAYRQALKRFVDIGLETHVSELEVYDTANNEAKQADYYDQAVRAAREAGVSFINLWQMTDSQNGQDADNTSIYEDAETPKPSYAAFQQALRDTQ